MCVNLTRQQRGYTLQSAAGASGVSDVAGPDAQLVECGGCRQLDSWRWGTCGWVRMLATVLKHQSATAAPNGWRVFLYIMCGLLIVVVLLGCRWGWQCLKSVFASVEL